MFRPPGGRLDGQPVGKVGGGLLQRPEVQPVDDGRLGAYRAVTGKLRLRAGQEGGIALPGLNSGRHQGRPRQPLGQDRAGGLQPGAQPLQPVVEGNAGLEQVECAPQLLLRRTQHKLDTVAHIEILQAILTTARQQPGPALLHPLNPPGHAPGRIMGAAQHARAQDTEPLTPAGAILLLAQHLERAIVAGHFPFGDSMQRRRLIHPGH